MSHRSLEGQLVKYLTDAHSIERQALAQLKVAPRIAGDERIAAAFSDHLSETFGHERIVDDLLRAREAKPSLVKDLAGSLTGAGFAAFAAAQPDTPGKLVVHAFSYEHMEEAAYDMLARVADRADDPAVHAAARAVEQQERDMGDRLESCFGLAVEASWEALDPSDAEQQLDKYLSDAHAIEGQALQLLAKAPKLAGAPRLAAAYESHRLETENHRTLVADRLRERGGSPSHLKEAALRAGALNWGAFFQAQPDTPAKLAAFSFAFEHLEIGAYELLARVAAKLGDTETEGLAHRIIDQERAAAQRIRMLFDEALSAGLQENSVAQSSAG